MSAYRIRRGRQTPSTTSAVATPILRRRLLIGVCDVGEVCFADFQKYPPRQKPASFNLDAVMRTLQDAHSSAGH